MTSIYIYKHKTIQTNRMDCDYTCLRCGYEGVTKYNLERHLNITTPCNEIRSTIPREDVLGIIINRRAELQTKLNLENRTCGGCNKVFGSTDLKNRHLKRIAGCMKFIQTKEDLNKKDAEIATLKEALEKFTTQDTQPIENCNETMTNDISKVSPIDVSVTQNISNQTTNTTQNFTGPITQTVTQNIYIQPTFKVFQYQDFDYLLSNSDLMDKTVQNLTLIDLLKAMYMDKEHPRDMTVKVFDSGAVRYHGLNGWKSEKKEQIYNDMIGEAYKIVKRYIGEKNRDYFIRTFRIVMDVVDIWMNDLNEELYQNAEETILPGIREDLDALMQIHCKYKTPIVVPQNMISTK